MQLHGQILISTYLTRREEAVTDTPYPPIETGGGVGMFGGLELEGMRPVLSSGH